MPEREIPDIKNITYGEKVSPIHIESHSDRIETNKYLLEGMGEVSFLICPLGAEDAESSIQKNPKEDKLNILFGYKGEIALANAPRHLYEIIAQIDYPNLKTIPRDLKCRLTIGDLGFISEIANNDPRELWVGFSEWINENTPSGSLVFEENILAKIQVQFVK